LESLVVKRISDFQLKLDEVLTPSDLIGINANIAELKRN